MRRGDFGLTVGAALVVSQFFLMGAAAASPFKWCAQYSNRMGGGTNCGFVTIEQCRETISGMGGICRRNPHYTGSVTRRAGRSPN